MTEITIAQDAPVLVAIDIAKARHEVLIAVPDKKRRRRLAVLNQLTDFNRLIAALKEYGRPVRAAFEATGNYHRALAYHLVTAGFEVKLVSSVALARTREALNNSWDKNDPKDAQVILHMMEIGNEQYYHDPLVCGTNDIQELSKTHDIGPKETCNHNRLCCGTVRQTGHSLKQNIRAVSQPIEEANGCRYYSDGANWIL